MIGNKKGLLYIVNLYNSFSLPNFNVGTAQLNHSKCKYDVRYKQCRTAVPRSSVKKIGFHFSIKITTNKPSELPRLNCFDLTETNSYSKRVLLISAAQYKIQQLGIRRNVTTKYLQPIQCD